MSWIHHADMIGLFLLGLDHPEAKGPINGTAPNPVTNKQFGKALGRALHRPAFMWTPKLMLRIFLGEVANIIATGQRVLPKKALALGYQFKFPHIDEALADIVQST
jgi:NAD dependent epimerase/dehydratase family enzyme